MRELLYTTQMKRDLRLIKNRGKDLKKLEGIVDLLQEDQPLLAKHRNHKLSGNYTSHNSTCGFWLRRICPIFFAFTHLLLLE